MDNRKIVFMFSGQGAQHPGMGHSLYENSAAAREVFDIAEKLRPGTLEQCFSGSEEELSKTENTQPCLYLVDLAAALALREAGIDADILAGFSLGELAALTFSAAISYEDGFSLVCKRAELMQKAAQSTDAGMAAILKLSDDQVEALCMEYDNLYPVNYNCPGQIVVAGKRDELELFKNKVNEAGGRYMTLKTSGAFHSPFMAEASADFAKEIKSFTIKKASVPLYSNVTAKPYEADYADLLAKQIRSPVKWEASVREMISVGASIFVETGPGKTLCGLVQRISDQVSVYNVEDSESLKQTCMALGR